MEFDVTEKNNCYVCEKLGHLKRNCPKKTIKMSEKWIEMIENPETIIKINHENLSWTTCSDDQCKIHRSFKKNVKWYPKKKIGKKPNMSNRFYLTKTPVTAVMMINIGKSEIPALITQNRENMISTSFVLRPQFQTRKVCRERLPKFEFGSLGKRSERSNTLGTSGTLATFQTCQTFLTFHFIYIYRYFADKQLFF